MPTCGTATLIYRLKFAHLFWSILRTPRCFVQSFRRFRPQRLPLAVLIIRAKARTPPSLRWIPWTSPRMTLFALLLLLRLSGTASRTPLLRLPRWTSVRTMFDLLPQRPPPLLQLLSLSRLLLLDLSLLDFSIRAIGPALTRIGPVSRRNSNDSTHPMMLRNPQPPPKPVDFKWMPSRPMLAPP